MSITISDLNTRLASKIHGASLDKVDDPYGLIFEAAGNVLLSIDPKETIRTAQLANALYDQVYSSAAPTDLKKDRIIDVRPQVNRTSADNFTQTTNEQFGLRRENNTVAVRYNSGIRTIEISKSLVAGSTINDCNSVTDNGTWVSDSNVSNIAQDTQTRVTGSGSISFDIGASTPGSLVNSTMTAVDLSSYVNKGSLFMWVYLPTASIVTSITLRWGSSAANYQSRAVTTTHDTTAFVNGWNLLRFDWSGSSTTGTINSAAVNYLHVSFATTSTALPSVRIDSIVARLGTIYEMEYYSRYLFQTAAGVWIEKPTIDTDIINLDVDGFNILLYEVAELLAHELQGEDSSFDIKYISEKKKDAWDTYKVANKSQRMKRQVRYYRMK